MIYHKKNPTFRQLEFVESLLPATQRAAWPFHFGHGFLDRLAWNSGNPQKSWEFGSDEVEHFSIFFFCLFSWWYFYGFQQWGYVSLREGTNILSFLLHFGAILMDSTMVSSSIFPPKNTLEAGSGERFTYSLTHPFLKKGSHDPNLSPPGNYVQKSRYHPSLGGVHLPCRCAGIKGVFFFF